MLTQQILYATRIAFFGSLTLFLLYKTGQMLEPVPAVGPVLINDTAQVITPVQTVQAVPHIEAALDAINDETIITVINKVTGENETLSKYT